jgi:hypothetical protein
MVTYAIHYHKIKIGAKSKGHVFNQYIPTSSIKTIKQEIERDAKAKGYIITEFHFITIK